MLGWWFFLARTCLLFLGDLGLHLLEAFGASDFALFFLDPSVACSSRHCPAHGLIEERAADSRRFSILADDGVNQLPSVAVCAVPAPATFAYEIGFDLGLLRVQLLLELGGHDFCCLNVVHRLPFLRLFGACGMLTPLTP